MGSQWSSRWSMARMPVPTFGGAGRAVRREGRRFGRPNWRRPVQQIQAGRRAARQASAAWLLLLAGQGAEGAAGRWAMPQKSRAALQPLLYLRPNLPSRQKNSLVLHRVHAELKPGLEQHAHQGAPLPGPRAADPAPLPAPCPPGGTRVLGDDPPPDRAGVLLPQPEGPGEAGDAAPVKGALTLSSTGRLLCSR